MIFWKPSRSFIGIKKNPVVADGVLLLVANPPIRFKHFGYCFANIFVMMPRSVFICI